MVVSNLTQVLEDENGFLGDLVAAAERRISSASSDEARDVFIKWKDLFLRHSRINDEVIGGSRDFPDTAEEEVTLLNQLIATLNPEDPLHQEWIGDFADDIALLQRLSGGATAP